MSEEKLARWYFGGLGAAGAAVFTHPLDLIKVQLQTQTKQKLSIIQLTIHLLKTNGIMGIYNGLTASLCRQLTYSTLRFAVYDTARAMMGKDTSFTTRMCIAFAGGTVGGFVGTPPDKINVRMQNDVRLPMTKRYNYKHVFDGLWKVYKHEGIAKLFTGGGTASLRAGLMAIGQISFYDQVKRTLLDTPYFEDNLGTHLTCSLIAGGIATAMTQPLDVVKTRIMNAKPGEFKNVLAVVSYTAKEGPIGFFRGFVPAFLRIGPHTILTFVLYEQLRIHFGYYQEPK